MSTRVKNPIKRFRASLVAALINACSVGWSTKEPR